MRKKLLLPFWARTKSLIKSHKITQQKFAQYAEISYSTLKNWIYYGVLPDVNSAYKIATALGVSMEYLVTGADGKIVKRQERETLKRKIVTADIFKLARRIERNAEAIG